LSSTVPICDNVRSETYQTRAVIYAAYGQLRTIQSTGSGPDPTRPDALWSGVEGSGRDAVGGGVSRSRIGITVVRWTAVTSRETYVKQRAKQTSNKTDSDRNAQLRRTRSLDICIKYVKICAHAMGIAFLSYVRAQKLGSQLSTVQFVDSRTVKPNPKMTLNPRRQRSYANFNPCTFCVTVGSFVSQWFWTDDTSAALPDGSISEASAYFCLYLLNASTKSNIFWHI